MNGKVYSRRLGIQWVISSQPTAKAGFLLGLEETYKDRGMEESFKQINKGLSKLEWGKQLGR